MKTTFKKINPSVFVSAAAVALFTSLAVIAGPSSQSATSAGQKALPFHAKSLDGKTINFPDDYKGKVVLLDFLGNMVSSLPGGAAHVVAAYDKFHSKGFEVLSVSLDQPRQGPALLQFVKDKKMSWPQIYDGKYWNAAIAVQYGVHSIPCPVVVDGDTGMILASEDGARGDDLEKVVDKALAAKMKK